jgi:anti-sigma regulatory factor (Ser/Thr protein kinase)
MKRKYSTIEIREFIIANVEANPNSISRMVSEKYKVSRQSVHRYLINLIQEGLLKAEGNTRNRQYLLKPIINNEFDFQVIPKLDEDILWREKVRPYLNNVKSNILDICHHGITEMINNVLDHSRSSSVTIGITTYTNKIELRILDKGIGIFKKIFTELNLEDERHAVLELTKGKVTTDKAHHTGEGIFFTSRMFDQFSILSGSLYYSHTQGEEEDWLLQDKVKEFDGTSVFMSISTNSTRTIKEVFDKYTSAGDDYSFTRTHVPVTLSRVGEEQLISRSQAKRLLARLEPFKEVFLDFEGVESIGQAFADEIFRVFKNAHPDIKIVWIRASDNVKNMIKRVMSGSLNDDQLKLNI